MQSHGSGDAPDNPPFSPQAGAEIRFLAGNQQIVKVAGTPVRSTFSGIFSTGMRCRNQFCIVASFTATVLPAPIALKIYESLL